VLGIEEGGVLPPYQEGARRGFQVREDQWEGEVDPASFTHQESLQHLLHPLVS